MFSESIQNQESHGEWSSLEYTALTHKEMPGNCVAPSEKKKSKKKSKGGISLGKRKRQPNRIRKSED